MELPSWTLAVPFVVLASALAFGAYHDRERLAGRELNRLARKTTLADPGGDWDTLVSRQGRRDAGRVIGLFIVFMGWLPLSYWSTEGGGSSVAWWLLLLPVGQTLGAAAGQLHQVTTAAPVARVAAVRRRQLRDYVRPSEVAGAAASTVLPAAAVVIAAVTLVDGTSTPVAAGLVVLSGALSLALLVVLWWVVHQGLRQPVAATTHVGLEWGEVLRSQLLRDQLGAVTFVSACGGGGALLWGLTTGMGGLPDWERTAAPIVAVVSVIVAVIVISFGAAVVDRRFVWVRAHVLVGQRA